MMFRLEDTYHVDQNFQRALPLLQKLRRIMLLPLALVFLTKVALESLLSPRAVDWVRDRREGRDGLVLAGVLQELEQDC